MSESRHDLQWMHLLGEALDEMTAAYAEARQLVFDRYPSGVSVDDERLTAEERHSLQRLYAAERTVRTRSWESTIAKPEAPVE